MRWGNIPSITLTESSVGTIDLRSDTVTKPTAGMRAAMAAADVGDDVYGEDPTVNRLEALAAELLGKEAALFVCSGTQSNLLGVMAHCERGDEYLVGQQAHTYKYEGGGAAVLGSIQPQPLDNEPDGSLDLSKLAQAIKPHDDPHFARTRLLCLENTQGGKVLPMEYLGRAEAFARGAALGMHLDGARLFNASVKLGISAGEIAQPFDTISICLSKGLGAPVGSLLCGRKDLIAKARRWRKVLGGGMRQAGVLAAAGIYALTRHVERLAEDHANAHRLAKGLEGVDEVSVDPWSAHTNMVFLRLAAERAAGLKKQLAEQGILIGSGATVRLVTHLDVSQADMDRVISAVKASFTRGVVQTTH